jgi:hypothetical protein
MPTLRQQVVHALLLVGCAKSTADAHTTPLSVNDPMPKALRTAYQAPPPPALASLPVAKQGLASYLAPVAAVEDHCAPSPSDSLSDINLWASKSFVPCLEQRTSKVQALERELIAMVGVVARTGAAGLIGHMYEVLADELLNTPVPREVAGDPVVMAIYLRTLHEKARPYLDKAQASYAACADNAESVGAETADWGDYCKARRGALDARLKTLGSARPPAVASGVPALLPPGAWQPPPNDGVLGVLREEDGGV